MLGAVHVQFPTAHDGEAEAWALLWVQAVEVNLVALHIGRKR